MLNISHISKTFKFKNQSINVLNDINLSIQSQDFISLTGDSGSGKTTLLNIIMGLVKPSSGNIQVQYHSLKLFRQNMIGFVFQNFNFIHHHTILENLTLPLKFSSIPPKHHTHLASQSLLQMKLLDKKNYYPHMLSGGQLQRIGIARALIKNPKIIIADEPTAHLNQKNTQNIFDIFTQLNAKKNIAFLISTHDPLIISNSPSKYQILNKSLTQKKQ